MIGADVGITVGIIAILAALMAVLRVGYQTTNKIDRANDMLFGDKEAGLLSLNEWQAKAESDRADTAAKVERILHEVTTNDGSSLKDAVHRTDLKLSEHLAYREDYERELADWRARVDAFIDRQEPT